MPETPRSLGPYQIVGQLGAGGMGEVYRALDTRVGREVALKILPESLAADEERRRRFELEARLAAALNHPNVMAIYDVGLDQRPPYIVSELVPGESLRALIARGALPVRKAADLAAQIAVGLAAAHAAGIVHRDLKPENVIVTPEGVAKVLDFGVARMQKKTAAVNQTITMSQTAAGSVVGTAAYMSPEQARGEEDIDHRSDQFTLGLVLYEMLAGAQAFSRPSAVQTMSAIVEDEPAPLTRQVPAQLRWILERCLAKEREGRYESTRDLARELAKVRDHFTELGATGTALEPAVKPARRRFPLMPLLASGVAGAVIALLAAMLLRDPAEADLAAYRVTPFATALTLHSFPSWSPDGKSIAFLGTEAPNKWQLYVQAVDAPTAVRVTGPEVPVNVGSAPFWSPDSRLVYFRCSMNGASGGICRVPAAGGASVLVQRNARSAALSPDGQTLAMWPSSWGSHEGGGPTVWTASPPDAPPKRYEPMPFQAAGFYDNPALAFSPDGKRILLCLALETRGETAWSLPWPPSKGSRAFTDGIPFAFTPQFAWMPDSRHVVFSDSTATSQSALYMAEAATGRYWPLLVQDRPANQPTLSPDGTHIAYTSQLSHSDVVAVPLGGGPVQTILGSTRDEERADASRVSQQLVYVTNRRGGSEVWLKSLAEGWERPLLSPHDVLTNGEPAERFLNPVFSPDGRRVAVAAISRSGSHLYTVFVSGGAPVRATSSNDLELCPTWSPDGNWLAYSDLVGSSPQLMKVRPGAGEAPAEIAQTYGAAVPVWSPTGEWIADHNLDGRLVLVNPDGKSQRVLPGDDGPVAWSRDGKTLYQVRAEPPALFAIDIATGGDRKLRDLPDLAPYSNGNPGLSAALTSDGSSIVYSVLRPRSEIWILSGIRKPRSWMP